MEYKMEDVTPQWVKDIFMEAQEERNQIMESMQQINDSTESDEFKQEEIAKLRAQLIELEYETMRKINPDYNMKELEESYKYWKEFVADTESDVAQKETELNNLRGQIIDLRQATQKIINPRWNDVPQVFLDELKSLRIVQMPIDEHWQEVHNINRGSYSQLDRDIAHTPWIKINYEVDEVWTKKVYPILSGQKTAEQVLEEFNLTT
jgi:predicted  nucleic acid-binding Zn-ribbon protein